MTTPAAAKKTAPARPTAAPGGGGSLEALVKRLDSIQIGSVGELNQFLDDLRALTHGLAVITALAAAEVKANLTAAAKSNSKLNIPGFNTRMAIGRVTKKVDQSANALADASAAAVSAWTTFEKEFDPILQNTAHTPRARRTFTFDS